MVIEVGLRGRSGEEATKAEDGAGFITTAAYWDDQVEMVLMNALRRAHITNMQARIENSRAQVCLVDTYGVNGLINYWSRFIRRIDGSF